jgi:integrase
MTRNPVNAIKLTNRRTVKYRKRSAWTVDDARWLLESTWHAGEALYAAFVLILVLDLRKGEVLGLTWEFMDLGRRRAVASPCRSCGTVRSPSR